MHLNYIRQIPKMRAELVNTKFLESVYHDFLTVLPLTPLCYSSKELFRSPHGLLFFWLFFKGGAQEGSYRAGERARLTSSVDNTVETEPTNLW